jgi:hypothetical protein
VSPDPEQIEIEFPEEDYVSEYDYYVVEDDDHYSYFYDEPVDLMSWEDGEWANGEYNESGEA